MIPLNIFIGVMMTRSPFLVCILLPLIAVAALAGGNPQVDRFKATAERMHAWTTADKGLYPMLADFTDHYPRRLSGSEFLERGLDWIIAKMKAEGWDVKTQDVMVPHWERGAESLTFHGPYTRSMPFCALGGSVGTSGAPLRAKVLVVSSFE
jgi:carboxypeptidase Q